MQIYPRHKWRSADSLKLDCSWYHSIAHNRYKNQFFRFDFWPMLMYLYRVFSHTTLAIYKAYFKGRHTREYKENTCKKWPSALFSLKEATAPLHLRVLKPSASWSSLLMKWRTLQPTSSSSWCVSHVLGAVHNWFVTYWDPCKKGGIHILNSAEVLKW